MSVSGDPVGGTLNPLVREVGSLKRLAALGSVTLLTASIHGAILVFKASPRETWPGMPSYNERSEVMSRVSMIQHININYTEPWRPGPTMLQQHGFSHSGKFCYD